MTQLRLLKLYCYVYYTIDQRIEMVENVLQYVQACAQEDKVLQSLEESSITDGPEGTVYNKCLNRGVEAE